MVQAATSNVDSRASSSESGSAEISKEAALSLKATLGNAGTSRLPADLYYVLGALYWHSDMREEAELQLKKVAASCQRSFRFGRPDHPHVLGLLASVRSLRRGMKPNAPSC